MTSNKPDSTPEYLLDADEMLGTGYDHPTIEIQPPSTVIRRKGRELFEETTPAFVKFSTGFKQELKNIDGNALKVWVFIALSINRNTEQAHPGMRTIAEGTDLDKDTVARAVKRLEELGLLSVNREEHKYNLYEIPYVSANTSVPKIRTDSESVPISDKTVPISGESVPTRWGLNQINQSNQKGNNPPKKGDLVDGLLAFNKQAKEAQAVEDVLCQLEKGLVRSITRSGPWQTLAKTLLGKERKGEKISTWISWYMSDDFYAKNSWTLTPAKILDSWPQAFAKAATPQAPTVQAPQLPTTRTPMPANLHRPTKPTQEDQDALPNL